MGRGGGDPRPSGRHGFVGAAAARAHVTRPAPGRRGDDRAAATLDRAWPLAEAAGEAQRIVPLVEVEAESAWLEGRLDLSTRRLQDGFSMSRTARGAHERLAVWLKEAGGLDIVPEGIAEPYLSELEDAGATGRDVA